jgi:hypothetical protein
MAGELPLSFGWHTLEFSIAGGKESWFCAVGISLASGVGLEPIPDGGGIRMPGFEFENAVDMWPGAFGVAQLASVEIGQ